MTQTSTTQVDNTVNLETAVTVQADTAQLAQAVGKGLDALAASFGAAARSQAEAQDAQEAFLGKLVEAGQIAGALLALAGVWFVLFRGKAT